MLEIRMPSLCATMYRYMIIFCCLNRVVVSYLNFTIEESVTSTDCKDFTKLKATPESVTYKITGDLENYSFTRFISPSITYANNSAILCSLINSSGNCTVSTADLYTCTCEKTNDAYFFTFTNNPKETLQSFQIFAYWEESGITTKSETFTVKEVKNESCSDNKILKYILGGVFGSLLLIILLVVVLVLAWKYYKKKKTSGSNNHGPEVETDSPSNQNNQKNREIENCNKNNGNGTSKATNSDSKNQTSDEEGKAENQKKEKEEASDDDTPIFRNENENQHNNTAQKRQRLPPLPNYVQPLQTAGDGTPDVLNVSPTPRPLPKPGGGKSNV